MYAELEGNGMLTATIEAEEWLEIIRHSLNSNTHHSNGARRDDITVMDAMMEDLSGLVWDHELHIVVYSAHQAYGGAAEGGWWYTAYELVEDETYAIESSDWADTLAKYPALLAARQAWCKAASDPADKFTSTAHSEHYTCRLELVAQGDKPGALARQARPVYE